MYIILHKFYKLYTIVRIISIIPNITINRCKYTILISPLDESCNLLYNKGGSMYPVKLHMTPPTYYYYLLVLIY